jgi:hypothetical protein
MQQMGACCQVFRGDSTQLCNQPLLAAAERTDPVTVRQQRLAVVTASFAGSFD